MPLSRSLLQFSDALFPISPCDFRSPSHLPPHPALIAFFSSLLRWCGDNQALQDGMCLHAHIIFQGLAHDVFLQGLLVQMYGKCGSLDHSLWTFRNMPDRSPYAWNFIVRASAQQGKPDLCLLLFQEMLQQGAIPNKFTYVSAIAACDASEYLNYGKGMHVQVVNNGMESDCAIGTAIIGMYGTFGKLDETVVSFDMMSDPDVVACNAMLAVYAQNGQSLLALRHFCNMLQQSFLPTKATFMSMLDSCSSEACLSQGEKVHVNILGCCGSEVELDNALINMYGKCGNIHWAKLLFEQMSSRSIVTWTTLISLLASHDSCEDAFGMFCRMHQEAIMPERVTFLEVLSACSSRKFLQKGEQIHVYLGYTNDLKLITEIINMYGRCGSVANAHKMFDDTFIRDVVVWNAIISVNSQNRLGFEAFEIFSHMMTAKMMPTLVTFVSILPACTSVSQGRKLHDYILEGGFTEYISVGNALVRMYGKFGLAEDAWSTFNRMPNQDAVTWNSMIETFSLNGKSIEALKLFDHMRIKGVSPDKATQITILEAYANHPTKLEIEQNYDMEDPQCRVVIEGLSKLLWNVNKFFDGLDDHDVETWNAMAAVYVQHYSERDSLRLFDRMKLEGIFPNADSFIIMFSLSGRGALSDGKQIHALTSHSELVADVGIGTAVIKMYGNSNKPDDAKWVFNKFLEPNTSLWNAMISVHVQCGQHSEALTLSHKLQEVGIVPTRATYINMLEACTKLGFLQEGKKLHACIFSMQMSSDVVFVTALIDMYSKCGNLEDVCTIFLDTPSCDILLWNTMISLYSQHGLARDACQLLEEMQKKGLMPDKVTFISILTVCSYCGLVDDGFWCLDSMLQVCGVSPTKAHHVCIVDLLGRAGRLDIAWTFLRDMPFQPAEVPYLAFLRACQQQADLRLGEWAAKHSFELDRGNTAPYVLLSNINAGYKKLEIDTNEKLDILELTGLCY